MPRALRRPHPRPLRASAASPRAASTLALLLGASVLAPLAGGCNRKTEFANPSNRNPRLEKEKLPEGTGGPTGERVDEGDANGKPGGSDDGAGKGAPGSPPSDGDKKPGGADGTTGTSGTGGTTTVGNGGNGGQTTAGTAGNASAGAGGQDPARIERPLPAPGDIEQDAGRVKASCDAPGARKLTITKRVTFAERGATCAFGTNENAPDAAGNLAPGPQDRISARVEETRALELPEGATLCDVSFFTPGDASARAIKFNDEILITFEGVVVASSYDYTTILLDRAPAAGELVPYRWEKLRGFQFKPRPECEGTLHGCFQSRVGSAYCLGADVGAGRCTVPPTETASAIRIELDPATTHRLSALARRNGSATFGLVTLGDNDRNAQTDRAPDCTHGALSFDVRATVVLP